MLIKGEYPTAWRL